MKIKYIDPHEIERRVILSLILEPLAEKEGCTTRTKDISGDLRLADLQVAAINVGQYFYELALRVKKENGQPKIFYDLAFEALKGSTKNIKNDKFINFGLVEILFPIVLSQLVYGGRGIAVIKNTLKVLKNSSPTDARFKDRMRTLAWSTSRKSYKRQFPINFYSKNLYENYRVNIQSGKERGVSTHSRWSLEMTKGLPILQRMYKNAKKHSQRGLITAIEECYKSGLKEFPKEGVIADYTAAVAYLLTSESKERRII